MYFVNLQYNLVGTDDFIGNVLSRWSVRLAHYKGIQGKGTPRLVALNNYNIQTISRLIYVCNVLFDQSI